MFNTLQQLFDRFTAASPQETPAERQHALGMAAAVLLVEAMRADADHHADELQAVQAALRKRFGWDDEQELARLIAQAEAHASQANDYFRFTSQLNEHCGQADKVALVEAMWSVAYADGALNADEMHVISKVAGLLHVTHGEYIAAKLHAKQAAGLS